MHSTIKVLRYRTASILLKSQSNKITRPLKQDPIRFLWCSQLWQMNNKEDHLERTANQFRQTRMYQGVVHDIQDPSEDVRTITLKVSDPGLTFKAGQWVDFDIPGVQPVVGLSMTSSPHLAETQGILDLAVRYSVYPPTHWIHKDCKLGDTVTLRVGGEFFYDPQPGEKAHDLLLIGGGVGINPLVSIAQHYVHLLTKGNLTSEGIPNKMIVLYSAKNQKALVFRNELQSLAANTPSMSCHFFATNEHDSLLPSNTSRRRINIEDLAPALSTLNKENVVAYICGPSSMTDEMEKQLRQLGIPDSRIRFEKWW